jgi:hypothetical protein
MHASVERKGERRQTAFGCRSLYGSRFFGGSARASIRSTMSPIVIALLTRPIDSAGESGNRFCKFFCIWVKGRVAGIQGANHDMGSGTYWVDRANSRWRRHCLCGRVATVSRALGNLAS